MSNNKIELEPIPRYIQRAVASCENISDDTENRIDEFRKIIEEINEKAKQPFLDIIQDYYLKLVFDSLEKMWFFSDLQFNIYKQCFLSRNSQLIELVEVNCRNILFIDILNKGVYGSVICSHSLSELYTNVRIDILQHINYLTDILNSAAARGVRGVKI